MYIRQQQQQLACIGLYKDTQSTSEWWGSLKIPLCSTHLGDAQQPLQYAPEHSPHTGLRWTAEEGRMNRTKYTNKDVPHCECKA